MDRLRQLQGSSGPTTRSKASKSTAEARPTTKKPHTTRASTPARSEFAGEADAAYGSFEEHKEFQAVLKSAHLADIKHSRLFNQDLDLTAWYKKRDENAARVNEHLHKPFTQDFYHYRYRGERVFRVWIPTDPDESPYFGPRTSVRTVHNKSRAHIVRLIEDQLEATEEIYSIRQQYLGKLADSIAAVDNPFKEAKKNQTVLALRLQGVEVTQYQGQPDRFEVYWEDLPVKMGV